MSSVRLIQAHEEVMRAAIRVLSAEHGRSEDPNSDAEAEYADEQLAIAARELTRATDAMPADQRPVGWNTPDVAVALDESWAVLLDESRGTFAYGPFEERPLADRFAAFLTAAVDPARVVPLTEVGPARPVVWRSPLVEMLTFYERVVRGGGGR